MWGVGVGVGGWGVRYGGMGGLGIPGRVGVDILGVVGTWDTYTPVPTPSGGHQNTHGWQAGDTHPTGTLSCLKFSGLTK